MGSYGEPNGHFSLPNKDSADIYLEIGTRDEIIAQSHSNSSEWAGVLNLDAYLRREDHLADQELTRDGGLTPWMLVYQPDKEGERHVLCGCETIKKKALVGKAGKVQDVVSHGVCSVFCSPENRGKGYAGRMMVELGKKLKSWQTEDSEQSLFSVLFSDIGKDFYAARGWHPFPSAHVSLPAASAFADGLPTVRMLMTSDLSDLCALDEKIMRKTLSRTKHNSRSAVAIVPDSTTLRWHHAREEFVAKELFNSDPDVKGAMTGEVGSRVWCFWTRVWTNKQEEAPNTLHILRLVIEDESFSDFDPASDDAAKKMQDSPTAKAIAALFAAAQSEAAQWKMNEVSIWNPTSTTLAAARLLNPEAEVEHREKESITSLLWYGEGSWQNVDWVCNEKYGWC